MKKIVVPGINIQWPWSQLLLSGKKTVETRGYELPAKHVGKPLVIIETAGPRGKKEAGIDRARIVGLIVFRSSFQYQSNSHWRKDHNRHLVDVDDPMFAWGKSNERWGWEVESVKVIEPHQNAPKKKGIVFTSACTISI
ncbi:MAG: ASCH domain-containing protein [Deltaproteobacteria bacterium]|jgi:hypothetical protein|nr:ASCH domain-containing protein [Deltaproteobacteria bacterium]